MTDRNAHEKRTVTGSWHSATDRDIREERRERVIDHKTHRVTLSWSRVSSRTPVEGLITHRYLFTYDRTPKFGYISQVDYLFRQWGWDEQEPSKAQEQEFREIYQEILAEQAELRGERPKGLVDIAYAAALRMEARRNARIQPPT